MAAAAIKKIDMVGGHFLKFDLFLYRSSLSKIRKVLEAMFFGGWGEGMIFFNK